MHDRTLQIIREAIRTRNYVMTLHAEEEMNEDDMNIFDVERVLLSGKIIEIQKDRNTAERKYIVEGRLFDELSGICYTDFFQILYERGL